METELEKESSNFWSTWKVDILDKIRQTSGSSRDNKKQISPWKGYYKSITSRNEGGNRKFFLCFIMEESSFGPHYVLENVTMLESNYLRETISH